METQREYLIKVKIPKLVFFILVSLPIPTCLLIANDMNPAVLIFFIIFFIGSVGNQTHGQAHLVLFDTQSQP